MSANNQKAVPKEIQSLAARAVKYVNSREGQTAIKGALEKSTKVAKELQKDRKMDSKELHEPMTI